MKKTSENKDFPTTNMVRRESDTSSLSSASYIPVGRRSDIDNKKRKNDLDSSLQEVSRVQFPLIDKRSRPQRTRKTQSANTNGTSVLSNTSGTLSAPTSGVELVSTSAPPMTQSLCDPGPSGSGTTADLRTAPIFVMDKKITPAPRTIQQELKDPVLAPTQV